MKMKNLIILLLIASIFSCHGEFDNFDVVIEDITIIDVKNSKLLPNQTIYIKGNRIENITTYSRNINVIADTVINAKGKFISSGFWDMHVHSCWKSNLDKTIFPAFLKFGITGIRDMGGSLEVLNTFKKRAKAKPDSYPNLFGAGPIIDGENPIHPAFSVAASNKNIKRVLDSLTKNNVDFFKVYSLLHKDVLDSIATYSKNHKIDFSGHISEYISPEYASSIRQKSFEHLNKLEELQSDSIRLKEFVQIAKKNKNWICPTLILYQRKFEFGKGEFIYHPLFDKLDADLKVEWQEIKESKSSKGEHNIGNASAKFQKQKQLVKYFYDNDIPLLLGTDFAGMQFIYPGYSFHEEMKLMQEIGISQFEILRMATLNPATYLNVSDFHGTVEKNKIADLVIFDKNPTENIENALLINMVLKSGKIIKK